MKVSARKRNKHNPYEMDIDVLENGIEIPALNAKNIRFTERILKYDSNYNKDPIRMLLHTMNLYLKAILM